MRVLPTFLLSFAVSLLPLGATIAQEASAPPPDSNGTAQKTALPPAAQWDIDFVRDVQPIFRATCYSCHGAEVQEAGLRLDIKARALEGGDSGQAIAPGASAESPLLLAVAGLNEEVGRMPPQGEGTPLSDEQVGILRAWIEQGAAWPDDADEGQLATSHWSFQPLVRPQVPTTANRSGIHNPVDAFVLDRLQSEAIEPSSEAPTTALLRRVYLDLIGLPPAPDELQEFMADERPDAYERVVDRLLKSEHYGERWGRHWLDLARYADSDGYEKDRPRPFAWRYRQWVIDALNADMPFDQFTIEQIAGDLLPGATIEQRTATGLHRNTLHNTEGGADPEEDRVKKTIDRTNTLGTIWLGLTVGCAQCHSHKYDPITQRDYFSLYAFFNHLAETDIPAPTEEEQRAYELAKRKFDVAHAPLRQAIDEYVKAQLPAGQAAWEMAVGKAPATWSTLAPAKATSKHAAQLAIGEDGAVLASGPNVVSDVYTIEVELNGKESKADSVSKDAVVPKSASSEPALLNQIHALRLEVLPDKSLPKQGPGRADNGNFVLTTFRIASISPEGVTTNLPISAAHADFSQDKWEVGLALNDDPSDGWAVSPQIGQRHVAVFRLAEPLELTPGLRLVITLDQTYNRPAPHNLGHFRLSATASADADLEGLPAAVAAALQVAADQRTPQQQQEIAKFYRTIDPGLKKLQAAADEHARQAPAAPDTKAQAVSEQAYTARETRVFPRGDFLRASEGAVVDRTTPPVLPPIIARGERPDRLDLARWLISPENPLTPRVAVNRIWQQYFGRGLVLTSDDFGTQGEPPSHPELLDWLACELRDSGWSLKHVHRLIVTSRTYRQSSAARPDLEDVDPENVLLARQTRLRVEAEIVRDLALASSGVLSRRVGGPSVRPPQPAEYSRLTYANSARWDASSGADRYRRGMYTFFQRTSPYPMLMTFDSPDSTECAARRVTSNTPLQALTLWNDPVFFECAQHLGCRVVQETSGGDDAEQTTVARLRHLCQLCLGRDPATDELHVLNELLAEHRRQLAGDSAAVDKIVGTTPVPSEVDKSELAAWVLAGRTLLNLDEFITRP